MHSNISKSIIALFKLDAQVFTGTITGTFTEELGSILSTIHNFTNTIHNNITTRLERLPCSVPICFHSLLRSA